MRARRRFFTLLEVMIVLGILALISGVAVFNVQKFYKQQKTLDEMERVVQLIKTSIELMMLVDLDSEIRFSKTGDGILVELVPQSSVPLSAAALLKNSTALLKNIDTIAFEDAFANTILENKFSLQFFSKGFIMNRGIVRMQQKDLIESIVIPGYPAQVQLQTGMAQFPHDQFVRDLVENMTERTRTETASNI